VFMVGLTEEGYRALLRHYPCVSRRRGGDGATCVWSDDLNASETDSGLSSVGVAYLCRVTREGRARATLAT
jgi:hypothetical protein